MGLNVIDPRNQKAEVIASQIMHDSKRNFRYGNPDNPEQDGAPVFVPQGKYVYVAVITAESPLTEQDLVALSKATKGASFKIGDTGVVKQYFIPFVSEDFNASLDGRLGIRYALMPEKAAEKSQGTAVTKLEGETAIQS